MKKIIFLICLFFIGCFSFQLNTEQEFCIRIDESFGQRNIKLIEKAILKWGKEIDVKFKFVIINTDNDKYSWKTDHMVTIYFENDWKKDIADSAVRKKSLYFFNNYLGVTLLPSRDVFIKTERDLYRVALHEFGHVLGCTHSNKTYSIMFNYIHNGTMFILQENIDQAKNNIWFLESEDWFSKNL
jgi:hypothetical protein